jgi:hypothetical protein
VLNPMLREAVNWPSFIAAQFLYGIVVGMVVVRSEKVYSKEVFAGWPTTRLRRSPRTERQGEGQP